MGWILFMMCMLMLIDSCCVANSRVILLRVSNLFVPFLFKILTCTPSPSWCHSIMPKLLLLVAATAPLIAFLNLHLVVLATGVAGCLVYGRHACRKFPAQPCLWIWAVVVAVPALTSFVLDDIITQRPVVQALALGLARAGAGIDCIRHRVCDCDSALSGGWV
jgi:4-amino-4-deoxy-L-arabinose transferase-like glycosyltransferase